MPASHTRISIEVPERVDPEEIERARRQHERFLKNAAWLNAHAGEVYSRYRGKVICVAGEELFVGETSEEALARARGAHPDDDGAFFRYIPLEKVPRIY
jgi:hypothetical protein